MADIHVRLLRVAIKALRHIECKHEDFRDYDVCDGCYAKDALITIKSLMKEDAEQKRKDKILKAHFKNFE